MASEPGARVPGSEYVQSVERAFAVIGAFSAEHPRLSISEVAARAGLNRATARRFLHTLQTLGYVGSSGAEFYLRPRMLDLGFAYLSSVPAWDIVRAHLERLADELGESASCSILDGGDIIYTVRAYSRRFLCVRIEVGTRLPAYATSTGRVLLAALEPEALDRYLAETVLKPFTPRTITDAEGIRAVLGEVRNAGFCILDQELELGVRSLAVPLHDFGGRVFAAVNISTHVGRISEEQLRQEHVPALLKTAGAIDADLGHQRADAGSVTRPGAVLPDAIQQQIHH